MCKVLLVDTDAHRLLELGLKLKSDDMIITSVQTLPGVTNALLSEEFDAVIVDDSATGAIESIRNMSSRVGILLMSGTDTQDRPNLEGYDVWSVVSRKASIKDLREKIQEAHEYKKMSDTSMMKSIEEIDVAQEEAKNVTKKFWGISGLAIFFLMMVGCSCAIEKQSVNKLDEINQVIYADHVKYVDADPDPAMTSARKEDRKKLIKSAQDIMDALKKSVK